MTESVGKVTEQIFKLPSDLLLECGKTLKNICENVPITYWVISDTGSTDNTKEIIQKFYLNILKFQSN